MACIAALLLSVWGLQLLLSVWGLKLLVTVLGLKLVVSVSAYEQGAAMACIAALTHQKAAYTSSLRPHTLVA